MLGAPILSAFKLLLTFRVVVLVVPLTFRSVPTLAAPFTDRVDEVNGPVRLVAPFTNSEPVIVFVPIIVLDPLMNTLPVIVLVPIKILDPVTSKLPDTTLIPFTVLDPVTFRLPVIVTPLPDTSKEPLIAKLPFPSELILYPGILLL